MFALYQRVTKLGDLPAAAVAGDLYGIDIASLNPFSEFEEWIQVLWSHCVLQTPARYKKITDATKLVQQNVVQLNTLYASLAWTTFKRTASLAIMLVFALFFSLSALFRWDFIISNLISLALRLYLPADSSSVALNLFLEVIVPVFNWMLSAFWLILCVFQHSSAGNTIATITRDVSRLKDSNKALVTGVRLDSKNLFLNIIKDAVFVSEIGALAGWNPSALSGLRSLLESTFPGAWGLVAKLVKSESPAKVDLDKIADEAHPRPAQGLSIPAVFKGTEAADLKKALFGITATTFGAALMCLFLSYSPMLITKLESLYPKGLDSSPQGVKFKLFMRDWYWPFALKFMAHVNISLFVSPLGALLGMVFWDTGLFARVYTWWYTPKVPQRPDVREAEPASDEEPPPIDDDEDGSTESNSGPRPHSPVPGSAFDIDDGVDYLPPGLRVPHGHNDRWMPRVAFAWSSFVSWPYRKAKTYVVHPIVHRVSRVTRGLVSAPRRLYAWIAGKDYREAMKQAKAAARKADARVNHSFGLYAGGIFLVDVVWFRSLKPAMAALGISTLFQRLGFPAIFSLAIPQVFRAAGVANDVAVAQRDPVSVPAPAKVAPTPVRSRDVHSLVKNVSDRGLFTDAPFVAGCRDPASTFEMFKVALSDMEERKILLSFDLQDQAHLYHTFHMAVGEVHKAFDERSRKTDYTAVPPPGVSPSVSEIRALAEAAAAAEKLKRSTSPPPRPEVAPVIKPTSAVPPVAPEPPTVVIPVPAVDSVRPPEGLKLAMAVPKGAPQPEFPFQSWSTQDIADMGKIYQLGLACDNAFVHPDDWTKFCDYATGSGPAPLWLPGAPPEGSVIRFVNKQNDQVAIFHFTGPVLAPISSLLKNHQRPGEAGPKAGTGKTHGNLVGRRVKVTKNKRIGFRYKNENGDWAYATFEDAMKKLDDPEFEDSYVGQVFLAALKQYNVDSSGRNTAKRAWHATEFEERLPGAQIRNARRIANDLELDSLAVANKTSRFDIREPEGLLRHFGLPSTWGHGGFLGRSLLDAVKAPAPRTPEGKLPSGDPSGFDPKLLVQNYCRVLFRGEANRYGFFLGGYVWTTAHDFALDVASEVSHFNLTTLDQKGEYLFVEVSVFPLDILRFKLSGKFLPDRTVKKTTGLPPGAMHKQSFGATPVPMENVMMVGPDGVVYPGSVYDVQDEKHSDTFGVARTSKIINHTCHTPAGAGDCALALVSARTGQVVGLHAFGPRKSVPADRQFNGAICVESFIKLTGTVLPLNGGSPVSSL